jgi:putative glutamine amidotransferase
MHRPVIGITMDYGKKADEYALNSAYATSVEMAGGLPMLLAFRTDLALVGQMVDLLDGVILAGGDDLDPARYGEPRHPRTSPLDPRREAFEFAVLAEVEKRRMPVLGVCLGSQVMNVHRGGSLHQFLPEIDRSASLEHRKIEGRETRHPVALSPDAGLARRLGKRDVIANSSHKQSIKTVGRDLRILATAPDGVIEGIEDPAFPLFLGVQWHPERLNDEADHLAVFKLLVEKAREM